ncbi:MAG: SMC-Scp complex subunit ScpB [Patescibacteria group bacterium]
MQQDNQQLKADIAAVEALLFVYGEPISIKKISGIFKIDQTIADNLIKELEEKLKADNRGLMLIFSNNQVQLTTKPDFSSILENFIKEEFKENLTPASLETLALIAYLGPMSRVQIDYYRGVNSSFILRNLLIRGLIERLPNPQKNNIYLYQPSFDLLKYLGISKIEELPEYDKFKSII